MMGNRATLAHQIDTTAASSTPTLSMVVNYFNPKAIQINETVARLCLESLKSSSKESIEVIVSDGSGVESTQIRQRCAELGFTYTLSPISQNFEAIYNHGLRLARGEYCGMMEYDIFVVDGWDRKILSEIRRTSANVAAPYLSSCDSVIQQHGFVVRHLTFEPSTLSHNLVIWDRKAFAVLVPLDEQFNGMCNDLDMYMKIKAAGLRLIVCDAGAIIHYRRVSNAYVPWTYEEDHQRLRGKYPHLKYWDVYGLLSVADKQFTRSTPYRMLLHIAGALPKKSWARYASRHIMRLEPLFQRI